MIALHVGYKANIKAMHIAVQDFKGCGEKGGHGSEDGPNMAPSGSPLMAGAGNWEQSKLDGYYVEPVSGLVSFFLYFEGFCVEKFSAASSLLFV